MTRPWVPCIFLGMKSPRSDEWKVIRSLLPKGWTVAARETGAFLRARYLRDPSALLRLLLFHAVSDGGLRETVTQARASGIADMSAVALLKRLRTSGEWLAWLGAGLCSTFRESPRLPQGIRPRAVDSTTVQGPASKGTEWRVHYSLDLRSLHCDWCELTDATGAELLERTPVAEGDVLIGDRNYLRPLGVKWVVEAGGDVVTRLRWTHSRMLDERGRRFYALKRARRLRVGEVGAWSVKLPVPGAEEIEGRVVAVRLPAPLAKKAERRAERRSKKKGKSPDRRSIEAAHFVMLFTTLLEDVIPAAGVLELYRFRWQVELAFKRLKQLLKLGHLPHKDPAAAVSWIHAKLLVSLLLEKLYRNAVAFSPWGYDIEGPGLPE